jgi:hypothetical protein
VAVSIRPAGYDAEVVYLITLLQNLGRLVVQYHLADEASQIRRLMQPGTPATGEPEEPGMSEQGASMAVLGVDLEAIGSAVARWWGLDDSVLHMMRRLRPAAGAPPRERRRTPAHHRQLRQRGGRRAGAARAAHAAGLQTVVHRYGRTLNLSLRDLQAALHLVAPSDATPAGAPPRATAEARVAVKAPPPRQPAASS